MEIRKRVKDTEKIQRNAVYVPPSSRRRRKRMEQRNYLKRQCLKNLPKLMKDIKP